ncbi:serine hydrolase domain-containing protein [Embleya sp. NBC_00896]|uniref:serine hydrolase domain-containing protein n=1 Tax=Embleya sp. NBC_00896 TaxID=2975961 RepID=UPI003865E53C|nr:beta-lactamase family protein [Embleya sp. NBC_00896]
MRRPFLSRRSVAARTLAAATLAVAGILPVAIAPAHASPLVGVVAGTGTGTGGGDHDCPTDGLSPELQTRLDEAVQQVMREAGIPGVQVGVWMPGKGNYVRAFGVADKDTGEPMTDKLNMRIGSETKTFTATAVLELVDDGLVGLDDPISKYIDGVPNGDHIALRDLLDMRSGLFSYSADDDFITAFLNDPNRPFTPEELLAYAFKHPNQFPPGAQFQYSNTNYILLGLVVEKMSGESLRSFIHRRVIRPSHLKHTLFPQGAEFPEPYAHGYTNQTPTGEIADTTHWNPSWGWAAGAMISDLQDLKRWAKDVATGTLLKPATQAERLNVLPTGLPGAGYGLGIFNINGWIGHNGSLPGYESLTIYLPEEDATLVVLLNTDVLYQGYEPSTLVGKAITNIITPDHIYDIPPQR